MAGSRPAGTQSGHLIINREREFLGNEAPYGPLLVERFNIL